MIEALGSRTLSLPLSIFTPVQAAILLGIAAVLGAVLGSFINCLAWRMVHGESVLKGRSHCAECDHVLGAVDLIPVVSWFALRGRCRYCGVRVSPRYVIVEIVMAVLFTTLVAVHGFGIPTLVYWVLACVLMGLSLVDLDTFSIPNGFIVVVIVLWVASLAFMRVPSDGTFGLGSLFAPLVGHGWMAVALDGFVGALAIGGGILVFSLVFDNIVGRTSLGGGDIKLLFAVSLFLGLAGSFLNLLVACVFGLLFAFAQRLFSVSASSENDAEASKKESFRTKAIPFGPAIAAATMFTVLAGSPILTWYTGLW